MRKNKLILLIIFFLPFCYLYYRISGSLRLLVYGLFLILILIIINAVSSLQEKEQSESGFLRLLNKISSVLPFNTNSKQSDKFTNFKDFIRFWIQFSFIMMIISFLESLIKKNLDLTNTLMNLGLFFLLIIAGIIAYPVVKLSDRLSGSVHSG